MNPNSLVKIKVETWVLSDVCEDLCITERRVKEEECFEENDQRCDVRWKKELKQIVVRNKTLNHDGKENYAVTYGVGSFERWCQSWQEEGEHLHSEGKGNEKTQNNVSCSSLPKESKPKNDTRNIGGNWWNNRVNERHYKPRDPICTVTGSKNIQP